MTLTFRALLFRNFTGTVADGARENRAELPEDRITRLVDTATSVTGGTCVECGARRGARTLTQITFRNFCNQDIARSTKYRVLKRNFQINRNISAPWRLLPSTPTRKYVAEDISKVE